MKKPKAKYKKNDVVVHEERKEMMIIDSADFIGHKKEWLYTLRVVDAEAKGERQYKRYYEEKVNDICEKMKNPKAVKVLYGKK